MSLFKTIVDIDFHSYDASRHTSDLDIDWFGVPFYGTVTLKYFGVVFGGFSREYSVRYTPSKYREFEIEAAAPFATYRAFIFEKYELEFPLSLLGRLRCDKGDNPDLINVREDQGYLTDVSWRNL